MITAAQPGLSAAGISVPNRGMQVHATGGKVARQILCFGDSTVEGLDGGFDFWVQLLRQNFGYLGLGRRWIWRSEWEANGAWIGMDWKSNFLIQNILTSTYAAGDHAVDVSVPVGPRSGRFLIRLDDELLLVTGGNGTTVLSVTGGQFATAPADHAVGAAVSNPSNIGPYQSGFSTVGGADATLTWMRPSSGFEQHDLGANSEVAICCGEGAGGTITTSVDGGSTWQASTVASSGHPAVQLVGVLGADRSTPTIKVRTADANGNRAEGLQDEWRAARRKADIDQQIRPFR